MNENVKRGAHTPPRGPLINISGVTLKIQISETQTNKCLSHVVNPKTK